MAPSVSLILLNRNTAPVLPLVLQRLAEHTTYPDVELIVVDDGSDDGSVAVLRGWRGGGPELTLVEHSRAARSWSCSTGTPRSRRRPARARGRGSSRGSPARGW